MDWKRCGGWWSTATSWQIFLFSRTTDCFRWVEPLCMTGVHEFAIIWLRDSTRSIERFWTFTGPVFWIASNQTDLTRSGFSISKQGQVQVTWDVLYVKPIQHDLTSTQQNWMSRAQLRRIHSKNDAHRLKAWMSSTTHVIHGLDVHEGVYTAKSEGITQKKRPVRQMDLAHKELRRVNENSGCGTSTSPSTSTLHPEAMRRLYLIRRERTIQLTFPKRLLFYMRFVIEIVHRINSFRFAMNINVARV